MQSPWHRFRDAGGSKATSPARSWPGSTVLSGPVRCDCLSQLPASVFCSATSHKRIASARDTMRPVWVSMITSIDGYSPVKGTPTDRALPVGSRGRYAAGSGQSFGFGVKTPAIAASCSRCASGSFAARSATERGQAPERTVQAGAAAVLGPAGATGRNQKPLQRGWQGRGGSGERPCGLLWTRLSQTGYIRRIV
jgi:hypothetical protein